MVQWVRHSIFCISFLLAPCAPVYAIRIFISPSNSSPYVGFMNLDVWDSTGLKFYIWALPTDSDKAVTRISLSLAVEGYGNTNVTISSHTVYNPVVYTDAAHT